jgi:nucleoside-diphosphate-sugar epimerase
MTRTAFVTGATGFLGLNLIERLTESGWRVTALIRPESNLKYLSRFPVETVAGNVTDPDSVSEAMPSGVDAVFHLAGSLSLWSRQNREQDRLNVDGVANVISAMRRRGAGRMIHMSTMSVWGLAEGRVDETAEKLGRDSWINYQRSKYRGEQKVLEAAAEGLDAVILNPPSIIGRYDVGGWARFIRLAWRQKIPGVPPGGVSFCHAREVAATTIAAVDHGRRGQNYLLGGVDDTFLELIQTIGRVIDKPVPRKVTAPWLFKTMGRAAGWASLLTGRQPPLTPEGAALTTRSMFADCSKARAELGFRTTDLETMIRDSYQWLKAENLLDR